MGGGAKKKDPDCIPNQSPSMVQVEITDSAVGDHIPSLYGHIIYTLRVSIHTRLNTLCHFFASVQK